MKHIFLFIAVFILFNCKPEKEEPKPLTAPVLTTMEAGDITAISALSGGAISSDGGSPVTARGIVWSISHNPTLSDSVSEDGTGIGSFTSDLTPLKYSTTYYVRAYATNSIGTTYGNEVTFNTKAAVPSDGLVGWWPFNGNANDESGNGNDGQIVGALEALDYLGFTNSALQFNGQSDYVDIGNLNVTIGAPSSSWSVTAWFKTPGNDGILDMVIVGDYDAGDTDMILASWLSVWTHAYNNKVGTTIRYAPFGLTVLSENTYVDDSWHQVVSVSDNGILALYIDGVFISSGEYPGTNNYSDGPYFRFGAHKANGGLNEFFNGKLDDIAIYNRALTSEEIQKIYNGTGF